MDAIGEFPANEKQEGEAKEGIGVYTRNEDEWGEHHCKIPVVDATGGATSVFHNPGLERTEKEDANDVADGKADGNQNEDTTVEQTEKIEKANDTVQGKPKQCDKGGNLPGLVLWCTIVIRRLKVVSELLLTSHTFHTGGKKAKEHLDNEAPETGFLIFTPASISANVPAHTVAIDDEPFDSRISDTTRTA